MAIWQFDMHLLPEEAIRRRYGSIPVAIAPADIDAGGWWKDALPPGNFTESLSKLLPQAVSWSSSINTWGYEDGNRIDLVWDDDQLMDVFVRIDVRQISYDLVEKLLRLARINRWVPWVNGQVLRPSLGHILRAIRYSDAFKFVQDPEAFLIALDKEEQDSRVP